MLFLSMSCGKEGYSLTRWRFCYCQNATQLNFKDYLLSLFYFTTFVISCMLVLGQSGFHLSVDSNPLN